MQEFQTCPDMKFGHTVLAFEEELSRAHKQVDLQSGVTSKRDKIFSIYENYKRGKKAIKSLGQSSTSQPASLDCTPIFGSTPDSSGHLLAGYSSAPPSGTPPAPPPAAGLVDLEKEQQFFHVISTDVEAFNLWFEDQEEEAVMKLEVAKHMLHAAGSDAERARAVRLLVDLHGEMVRPRGLHKHT